jgi:hypothetical protein
LREGIQRYFDSWIKVFLAYVLITLRMADLDRNSGPFGFVQEVKTAKIPYEATSNVFILLKTFRDMVNYIRVGLEKNISSRLKLSKEVYPYLSGLGFYTWYSLSAVEIAASILKNNRKAKRKRD